MKKLFASLLFVLCFGAVFGQQVDTTKQKMKIQAYGYDYKNLGADSSFRLPQDTFMLRKSGEDDGAIASISGVIYIWMYELSTSTYKWNPISGGTSSGVVLVQSGWGLIPTTITFMGTLTVDSGILATKARLMQVADSLGNLITAPGEPDEIDTFAMATRLHVTKRIDSLALLIGAPGETYTFTNGVYNTAGNVQVDSGLIATRARVQKAIDSLAAVIPSSYTFSNGVFNVAGAVKVDSALMATRARVQKAIDSLGLVSGSYANYTYSNGVFQSGGIVKVDTALMGTRARVQKGIDSLALVATNYTYSNGVFLSAGVVKVDTALMGTRARIKKSVDSLALLMQTYTFTAGVYNSGSNVIKADSALMATRARLQKVIDSLNFDEAVVTNGGGYFAMVQFPTADSIVIKDSREGWGMDLDSAYRYVIYNVDSFAVASRPRVKKSIDSLGALITSGGTYTFSSGVFNSAGAVKVDTALIATRARVKKSIDSLALISSGAQTWQATLITGSTLTQNNTISGGANTFTYNSSAAGNGMEVKMTDGFGTALFVQGIAGPAIYAYSYGGLGLYAMSDSYIAASFVVNPASTNDVQPAFDVSRYVSPGVGANGVGVQFNLSVESSAGSVETATSFISKLTNATTASRVSEFSITGVDNAVTSTLFTLKGNGQMLLNKYVSSAFTGTAVNNLAVDASGNVIMVSTGAGAYSFTTGVYNTASVIKVDTALIATRARVKKSIDSLALLSPTYTFSAGVVNTGSNAIKVDTALMATRPRVKKSIDSLALLILSYNFSAGVYYSGGQVKADTALMATRPRVKKSIDSLALLIPAAKTFSTGLSDVTNVVKVDTALMATRARVQKAVDSLNLRITNQTTLYSGNGTLASNRDISVNDKYLVIGADSDSKFEYYPWGPWASSFGVAQIAMTAAADTTFDIVSKVDLQARVDYAFTDFRTEWHNGEASMNWSVYNTGLTLETHTFRGSEIYISYQYGNGANADSNALIFPRQAELSTSFLYYDSTGGTIHVRKVDFSAFGTGDGSVTSVATGFGLAGGTITTTGTLVADTFRVTSFVRTKKVIDSLGAIIGTKGTGTVTSVAAGYGMNFTTITTAGSVAVDTFAMATRPRVKKSIDSLALLIGSGGGGSGTVTSVSAGYGMNFTTITTAGPVIVDTFVMATRPRVKKSIDSLGALIVSSDGVQLVSAGYGMNFTAITTTGAVAVDTFAMATRPRVKKSIDSLALLISEAGGGTVLSVSAGYGMSFTTITSSGPVNVDTFVMATRPRVKKSIDSLALLIAGFATPTLQQVLTAGSILTQNNTITGGIYQLQINGTGTTGTSTILVNSGAGNAVTANSSAAGIGLSASSVSYLAGFFEVIPAAANTVVDMVQFRRSTSGVASSGIGGALVFHVEQSTGAQNPAGRMTIKWTDPVPATRTSEMSFSVVDNAVEKTSFVLNGDGSVRLPYYGGGAITGTVTKWLAVTSTGLVVEVDPPSGGGGGGGSGTVTSVGMTVPTGLSVTPASITTSGTFAITTALNGLVYGTGTGFAAASVSAPLTFTGGTLSMAAASTSVNGYLTSTNFTLFNNKVNTASNVGIGATIFKVKTGTNLEFKTVEAGTGISIANNTNSITITATGGGGGGSGTVTNFSAGNLSPLFTTSEATTTTTPALSFSLNTQNANLVFAGPATGAAAAPTFRALTAADMPPGFGGDGVLAEVANIGPATFFSFAYDNTVAVKIDKVLRVGHSTNDELRTITVNAVVMVPSSSFSLSTWTTIATLPSGYRPGNMITADLPRDISVDVFENSGGTDFGGQMSFGTGARYRINASGNIQVFVPSVLSYASLSGTAYLLFPIHVTYFYIAGT
jgi:hypothetical protein